MFTEEIISPRERERGWEGGREVAVCEAGASYGVTWKSMTDVSFTPLGLYNPALGALDIVATEFFCDT